MALSLYPRRTPLMWSFSNFRRLPRSAQAAAVLRGTVFLVCLTLGVWLVLWLLLVRPRVNLVAAVPKSLPVSLQSMAGLLAPSIDKDEGVWKTFDLSLGFGEPERDEIRRKLAGNSGRPTILYVTAPVAPVDVDQDPTSGTKVLTLESLGRLIDICLDRPEKSKLLLIVDPGRAAADASLGDHQDDIAFQLKERATPPRNPEEAKKWKERWRNFAILCACSPEQCSWAVEGQGRTIFDRVLNQSLAEPRKLQKAVRFVSYWVAALVKEFIPPAVQNPMLVGDLELDFFIRAEKPRPMAVTDDSQALRKRREKSLWNDLNEEYQRRDEYEKRKPYRYAPAAWREYQDRLLRAERLFRAHRLNNAREELTLATDSANLLTDRKTSSFGSLALGIRYSSNAGSYEALERQLNSALDQAQARQAAESDSGKAAAAADKKADKNPAAAKDADKTPGADKKADPTPAADKKADAAPAIARAGPESATESSDDLFDCIRSKLPSRRDRWKPYVEGQLIEWMAAYCNLPPLSNKPALFAGDREELFVRAIRLRVQSERAAALALEPRTALRWAIENCDQHRRLAQDYLFVGEGQAIELAKQELEEAQKQCQWAADCAQAMDLAGEIQSELPFLAAWHVRSTARVSAAGATNPALQVKTIADLAHELTVSLKTERSAARDEDYFRGLRRQYAQLSGLYQKLLDAFGRDLEIALGTPDWRPIDDVLLVPRIPREKRAKLVERIAQFPRELTAQQGEGETPATAPDAEPKNKATVEAARALLTRNFGMWLFGAANAALDSNGQPATPTEFEPAWIYTEPLKPSEDPSCRSIADGLKLISGPLKDLVPKPSESLAARIENLNGWMAERLVEDADAERAGAFRDAARAGTVASEAEQRIELLKKRKAGDATQRDWFSSFSAKAAQPLNLEAVPLSIEYESRWAVPRGVACLIFNDSEQYRGKIEIFRAEKPLGPGTQAPIKAGARQTIDFQVDRATDQASDAATSSALSLNPILFYRGQKFNADGTTLALRPIEGEFIIRLESDTKAIAAKMRLAEKDVPRDQFTKRPNAVTGFAYPGWFHPTLLRVLYVPKGNDRSGVEVDVECEGVELERPHLFLRPGEPETVASFEISFDTAAAVAKAKEAATDEFLREKRLVVRLWRSGKPHKGRPLAQQPIRLSEVNPRRFNTVEVSTTTAPDDPEVRTVDVRVRRLPNDPVVAPVGVRVHSIEGLTRGTPTVSRDPVTGSMHPRIDRERQVGLVRGQSCTFPFQIQKGQTGAKTYHFDVIFAGDYAHKLEGKITIGGTAEPAAERTPPTK
jgi:hypothetical protein